MQRHCSFMFLKWSFYSVRWNCHLVWYLSLQITSRFPSKMQPRQDLWIISKFWQFISKCNFESHASRYLPLIELDLCDTLTFWQPTRYSANLIKFESSGNSYWLWWCEFVSNGVTVLTAADQRCSSWFTDLEVWSHHTTLCTYWDEVIKLQLSRGCTVQRASHTHRTSPVSGLWYRTTIVTQDEMIYFSPVRKKQLRIGLQALICFVTGGVRNVNHIYKIL